MGRGGDASERVPSRGAVLAGSTTLTTPRPGHWRRSAVCRRPLSLKDRGILMLPCWFAARLAPHRGAERAFVAAAAPGWGTCAGRCVEAEPDPTPRLLV